MKRWWVSNSGQVVESFGLPAYLQMCRRSPWRAVKEIAACAAILAMMFGALYLKEILLWIEGVAR